MKNNNIVVIERDMHCPFCESDSAVLISETVREKAVIGFAPIGCKNSLLLMVTCGCWALVSGVPLNDVKIDHVTHIYGFCPCCGNSYPVNKPEADTPIDSIQNAKNRISKIAGQTKDLFGKGSSDSKLEQEQYDYDKDN